MAPFSSDRPSGARTSLPPLCIPQGYYGAWTEEHFRSLCPEYHLLPACGATIHSIWGLRRGGLSCMGSVTQLPAAL